MNIIKTKFSDVYVLEPEVLTDNRGVFLESYNPKKLLSNNIDYTFVQDNYSLSEFAGTVRGLHYQLPPKAQAKLVSVVSGAVFDVVVDIRKESSTYGQWLGVILSESNYRQLLVPKGYAHGFCTLVDRTKVFYKVDDYYSMEHERGILWNDRDLGIEWPVSSPILSEKDKALLPFRETETFF